MGLIFLGDLHNHPRHQRCGVLDTATEEVVVINFRDIQD